MKMTQENKELLLKDLCGRLPYKVIVQSTFYYCDGTIWKYENETLTAGLLGYPITRYKPYLFPLSNMTEEQEKELITITDGKFRYMWGDITNAIPRKNTSEWGISENAFISSIKVINSLYIWLLKNHFDYHRLIEKGLAIDATGLNIY